MKRKIKNFGRLSAAAKRVAIAKDVVAQIKAAQYRIREGIWLDVSAPEAKTEVPTVCQASLTGRVVQVEPAKCTCCALGAAMASSLRLFNVGEYNSDPEFDEVKTQLGRFFSEQQLGLIEAAFECRSEPMADFDTTVSDEVMAKAGKFSELSTEKRALAIFNNIIKNNGTFVP